MSRVAGKNRNALALFGTVLLGSTLSLGLYHVWDLEQRWVVVIFVAIAAVAVSMCFARRFSDFLLIVTLFSIPFATFTKWISASDTSELYEGAIVGTFGVGLIDFLLIGLYMSWFYRIFIIREEQLPRVNLLDGLILFYMGTYFLGSIGSHNQAVAFGATEYLLKHAMLYFYVSRHLREQYLPWLLAAFAFTIMIEVPLGSYQFFTGKLVGLALDKGAGGSGLNSQYEVPGVETTRAEGTSYDSHMLADYLGAILPFALVLLFTPRLRPLLKLGCLAASAGSVLIVIMTQSRTGWVSTAAVLSVGVILILVLWRERHVLPALAGLVLLAALITPFVADFIYERFAESPHETITTRYDQFKVASHIFALHPLFGVGPNNYVDALKSYDYIGMLGVDPETGELIPELLPVHNGFFLRAAEVGVVGLLAYLAVLASATWRLFSAVRARRDVPGRLALAALLGIMTIELNDQFIVGLPNPDVFLTFWLLVALAVALPSMPRGAAAFLLTPSRPSARPAAISGLAATGSSH